jgi:hypothetical protein
MGIIKLEFMSPIELDNLKTAKPIEKPLWYYEKSDTESLSINTDDWTIESINGKKAVITEWFVNAQTYRMMLKEEGYEVPEGFIPASYVFTVAMLGQLVDTKVMISFLSSIQDVFNKTKSCNEESEDKQDNQNKQKENE